ncbi:hypothetical protein Swit_4960 (plasmid) [Rhizorhabdus wittichii RW1]|uniref:Uncharacterized protein n=1 Tax=Rhizorhabdus wittichii (strain DSM 6014 / CCUG 31198 / JCM 15750 / NBRC 105917 / EY 4224 / RW1) TaxID=392499 RepID=A0A9J9HHG2_RHIWR|nr:hypothetical protein Swit_4960 [Rhizorhabdus wittichii RW1]
MTYSSNLGHEPTSGAMLGRQISIVGKRHSRRFPAQRIHDACKVFAAGEQVLVQPDPRGMGADALELSSRSRSSLVRSGSALTSNARWVIAR